MPELIKPTIINEIEFYVATDGSQTGMSVSGLAKLCGVAHQTISQRILGVLTDAAKKPPKSLESLQGKDLTLQLNTAPGTKIINSEACMKIIEYYAFESPNKTDVALDSFRKFAVVGLHCWILKMTGFTTTNKMEVSAKASIENIRAMRDICDRWFNVVETIQDKPGLASIVEEYSTQDYAALPAGKVTLKEYLQGQGIPELSRSDMVKLSNTVAATYKAHRGHVPSTITLCYKSSTGKSCRAKVYCYSVDDYPLIDAVLELMRLV